MNGSLANLTASDKAAHNFIARLKVKNPVAYRAVMTRLNRSVGMGAISDIWTGIINGINDIYSSPVTQDYLERERAAELAKKEAAAALREEQIALERQRIEEQNRIAQMELQRQLQELQNVRAQIELTGKQKNMLYIAGGLGALLLFLVTKRKRGR